MLNFISKLFVSIQIFFMKVCLKKKQSHSPATARNSWDELKCPYIAAILWRQILLRKDRSTHSISIIFMEIPWDEPVTRFQNTQPDFVRILDQFKLPQNDHQFSKWQVSGVDKFNVLRENTNSTE
jgi:hypothetical protein